MAIWFAKASRKARSVCLGQLLGAQGDPNPVSVRSPLLDSPLNPGPDALRRPAAPPRFLQGTPAYTGREPISS